MDPLDDLSTLSLHIDDLGPPSSITDLDQDVCLGCGEDPTWFCPQCGDPFCSICWDQVLPHRKDLHSRRGARTRSRVPHEMVGLKLYHQLSEVFDPKYQPNYKDNRSDWDPGAKWFYVRQSDNGDYQLGNFPRFNELTLRKWDKGCPEQFPRLVSFVGQTGAGKSTLVKLLLTLKEPPENQGSIKALYPITAMQSISPDDVPQPTTADVDLYPDQATCQTRIPLLFADCEGLNGGGQEPVTLKSKGYRHISSRSRRIKYATGLKREELVEELFPKILYTFSDVVVFVLREPRVFEHVVTEYLVPWAERSIEKVINQACLPHIIILVNGMDINAADDKGWDTEKITEAYLRLLDTEIKHDSALEKMAENVKLRTGTSINTIKGLLEHYYATVSVMCMPDKKQYNRIHHQANLLYNAISEKSEQSHHNKARVRMAPNAERMNRLISSALEHFAAKKDQPFDLLEDSLREIPNSGRFEGNILQFILTFRDTSRDPNLRREVEKLFGGVTKVIASCIFLDIERNEFPGKYRKILSERYQEQLQLAFDAFCQLWLPCTYQRKDLSCHNFKSTHGQKGHQGANGRIIGTGPFQTNFNQGEFFQKWVSDIAERLEQLNLDFLELQSSPSQGYHALTTTIAARVHHLEMANFFSCSVGNASKFVSNRVCLFCLRYNMPENTLPCGHTLCDKCLEMFVDRGSDWDTTRRLKFCPFHSTKETSLQGDLYEVQVKPPHAGVRILCLDGGGIRGIVELAILREIEKEFRNTLMIQWFFDLVVATSTGGIIALGLFVKNEPIKEVIKKFKQLCPAAFTRREFGHFSPLNRLAVAWHGSVYKNRPFEEILKGFFGSQDTLFGRKKQNANHTKVAITATSRTARLKPIIMSNYNRPLSDVPYGFDRDDEPTKAIKIWEVARATSAAFPFFKIFNKPGSDQELCDGGFYQNCPVEIALSESRLIWSDMGDRHPDVFLSLGTGYNAPVGRTAEPIVPQRQRRPRNLFREARHIAVALVQTIGDCQSTWANFVRESTEGCRNDPELATRYMRLDVGLDGKVPELDETDKVDELESLVNGRVTNAREVAHRLIASCFYFKPVAIWREHRGQGYRVRGKIRCRFVENSEQIKGLADFLKSYFRGGSKPIFRLERGYGFNNQEPIVESARCKMINIEEGKINQMRERGIFDLLLDDFAMSSSIATIRISLRLEADTGTVYSNGEQYLSISGSPQTLDADELIDAVGGLFVSPRSSEPSSPPPPYSPRAG